MILLEGMEFWQLFIRMITTVLTLWVIVMFMGKRLIGEISVLDFMIALIIGNIAGADLADLEVPHLPTIIAMIMLAIVLRLINYSLMKFPLFNRWVTFPPTLIVQNGTFLKDNMCRHTIRVDDVIPLLRKEGIYDINEVDYAVLEPNGDLSVLKKSQYQTPTKQDLNIPKSPQGLSLVMVMDGTIEEKNLEYINKDTEWLKTQLQYQGVDDISDLFLVVLSQDGSWFISYQKDPQDAPVKTPHI